MNTKNYVYDTLIGLICSAVIFISQPQYAQASLSVYDEIQSVNQEEIHTIDKPVQQDVTTPSDEPDTNEQNSNPAQDSDEHQAQDSLSDTNETNPENEVKTEENLQNALSEQNSKVDSDTTSDFVKTEQSNNKKSCYAQISEFFNKLCSLIQKLVINKIVFIKNSIISCLSEHNLHTNNHPVQKCTVNTPITQTFDYVPYYFITPSFSKNHLEKIVFAEKIDNIKELMQYTLAAAYTENKIKPQKNAVTPQGTTDINVLINAPSPQIEVVGKSLYAKLVIDIRNNTLYKYDKNGFPLKAYLVATGARGTRTMPGLRIVTYKERFPYSGAPNSKRALDPYSYGPYIIFLNQVNPKTGRQCSVEQLLHGNGNECSIGKKVSHGCVRTNNNVMRKELSKEVVRGDYILLINPD